MRGLKNFVLISCATILSLVPVASEVHCRGRELSLSGNEEVPLLLARWTNRARCTSVAGPIKISNLVNIEFPAHLYERVSHIDHGWILVANSTNVTNNLHFPSLYSIFSGRFPIITLFNNSDVTFSVGPNFLLGRNRYKVRYAIMSNKSPIIDVNTYNQLYLAAYPKGRFLFDSHLHVEPCQETVYKPLAAALGCLLATLLSAFATVALYDRKDI
uniref:Phosphatidylinositol-glycan biosynthesis class X protein n=1 Tax=Caenorhabditis japonica TaxID=281687 RepID=A0A8R1I4F4_CAEJA